KGAQARYHDPYILSLAEMGVPLTAVADLEGEVQKADCVVIATAHSVYDWASIAHGATLLVDTRFILKHGS
ncbi:MAG: UDP-N-acetyl-D-glucosamine dehydrogenase, partial [Caldilineaceae bacterium]|nr:UDP-N-acetyl-D-glucosamine dehydrogenase [Caldilineaceae bacterium]